MDKSESKMMIQAYAKNPINNFKMEDYDIKQHEWNFICWDDISVYLKINNNKISNYSFDGNCSTITTAAASFLAEIIIGENIENICRRNYNTFKEKGFEVSNRRKNAAVIALLASINWIYKFLWTEKKLDFEDITEKD